MASISCPHCSQPVEEDNLLCNHCGKALIPQYTSAQLQVLNQEEVTKYGAPTAMGCLVGLLLGVGCVLLIVALLSEPLDFSKDNHRRLPGIPMVTTVLGGAAGAMVAHVLAKRRRERLRKK